METKNNNQEQMTTALGMYYPIANVLMYSLYRYIMCFDLSGYAKYIFAYLPIVDSYIYFDQEAFFKWYGERTSTNEDDELLPVNLSPATMKQMLNEWFTIHEPNECIGQKQEQMTRENDDVMWADIYALVHSIGIIWFLSNEPTFKDKYIR